MSDKLDEIRKLADDVQAAPAFRKTEAGVRLFNALIDRLADIEARLLALEDRGRRYGH